MGRACRNALSVQTLFEGPLVRLEPFSSGERHVLGNLHSRFLKMQEKAEARQHPAALSEKKEDVE